MAYAVVAALGLVAIVDIWTIVAELHRASIVSRALDDPLTLTASEAAAADDAVQSALVADLMLLLVAGVLFIVWFHRLVRWVAAHRPSAFRYTSGWAIGGWFVPIWNLFRPKQMVDDAWRGTTRPGARADPPPVLFHVWWAMFLLGNLVSWARAGGSDDDLEAIARSDRIGAAADVVDIVAAVLAMLVVLTLARRVEDRSWAGPPGPAPGYGQFGVPPAPNRRH